ncbi:Phage integrase, N-terminal SAM-like domain [Natribacillus halophilus]|uniref:Phage integrase, N-terminal SAM-like domain n=2 Tax=Natribacillus halophilus TaxID=549003 RepID=A0A1G8PTL3_9BACI|nr:Phage integrase, N-terminal SAM-like domain [Natribacillus halophilus]
MWLAEYRENKAAKNTHKLDKLNIETRALHYFKNIRLKDITPALYQTFINYLMMIKDIANKPLISYTGQCTCPSSELLD